jgi:hypothetical protein
MTRRLGSDGEPVREQLDRLLDSTDCLIILVDSLRTVSYARGFGLSPCQLELVTDALERTVRNAVSGRVTPVEEGRS